MQHCELCLASGTAAGFHRYRLSQPGLMEAMRCTAARGVVGLSERQCPGALAGVWEARVALQCCPHLRSAGSSGCLGSHGAALASSGSICVLSRMFTARFPGVGHVHR